MARPSYEEAFGAEAVPGSRGDTPLSELRAVAEQLELRPGGLLIDLGCGPGGPGLWLARRLKAVLLGLDLDIQALELARRAAQGYPATYLQRDFHATGLEGGRADGVVAFDALWHSPRLPQALEEALRLLKPGGRLALTLVETEPAPLPGLIYERRTEGWRERRALLEPERDLTGLERRLVVLRRPAECPAPER